MKIPLFTIIAGHYGVGKTNLALNVARMLARDGAAVVLVDLDVVNPYFRSSDYPELLEREGVRLIAPTFARTTLESPSLPADVALAFAHTGAVIFDVGGDDDGATTLGRYRRDIEKRAADAASGDYAFWYVVNRYRNLSTTPVEACGLLREIEAACGLRATGIVNNSHLQAETTLDTVTASLDFGTQVAHGAGLPLVATTVPAGLYNTATTDPRFASYADTLLPIETLVTTPWQ